jgi:hypothetical protein
MQNNRRLTLDTETSLMRGVVVNTNDPEKRGRIKVRIPTLHGIPNESTSWLDDEFLPWAVPGNLSGAGNDIGQRLVPLKGTRVFIMFEDGSTSTPVYLGGIPLNIGEPKLYNDEANNVFGNNGTVITTNDMIEDFDEDSSPSAQGIVFKSLKGFTIYFDDTDGKETVKIYDQAGQSFIMESLEPITEKRSASRATVQNSRIRITHSSGINIVLDKDTIKLKNNNSTLEIDADLGFTFHVPSEFDVE